MAEDQSFLITVELADPETGARRYGAERSAVERLLGPEGIIHAELQDGRLKLHFRSDDRAKGRQLLELCRSLQASRHPQRATVEVTPAA